MAKNLTQFDVSNKIIGTGLTFKLGLTPAQGMVLLALAWHYNPKTNGGWVYPTYKRITELTGVGRRTIGEAIKVFEKIGIIIKRSVKMGEHTNNVYKFTDEFFLLLRKFEYGMKQKKSGIDFSSIEKALEEENYSYTDEDGEEEVL